MQKKGKSKVKEKRIKNSNYFLVSETARNCSKCRTYGIISVQNGIYSMFCAGE